ncbi:unnamed protein product [Laminaria digitata]
MASRGLPRQAHVKTLGMPRLAAACAMGTPMARAVELAMVDHGSTMATLTVCSMATTAAPRQLPRQATATATSSETASRWQSVKTSHGNCHNCHNLRGTRPWQPTAVPWATLTVCSMATSTFTAIHGYPRPPTMMMMMAFVFLMMMMMRRITVMTMVRRIILTSEENDDVTMEGMVMMVSRMMDHGYGRGGTPVFTTEFRTLARVALCLTRKRTYPNIVGAAKRTTRLQRIYITAPKSTKA